MAGVSCGVVDFSMANGVERRLRQLLVVVRADVSGGMSKCRALKAVSLTVVQRNSLGVY